MNYFKYPSIDLVATGKNITRLMNLKNLKVSDLQEAFGFEYPQAIYKWKRGECLPTVDNLVCHLPDLLSLVCVCVYVSERGRGIEGNSKRNRHRDTEVDSLKKYK